MQNLEKKYLQVTAVTEVRKDKNSKNYKRVSVSALPSVIKHPVTGEILPVLVMTGKKASFNQYEENYLDGSMDTAYKATINTLIEGAIVSKSVAPYSFPDAITGEEITAESYTAVVFGDSSDEKLFETATFAAFRRADHQLEGDTFVPAQISMDTEEPTEA